MNTLGIELNRDDRDGGSDAVLRQIYETRYSSYVQMARAMAGDHRDAEELVQESFARCCVVWRRKGLPTNPEAYVRTVVLNRCRSDVRHRVRWRLVEPPAAGSVEAAEAAALARVDQAALVVAIRALPRRQRECVALRYFFDLSTAETAAELAISTGSVKTHTHRALEALTVALGDQR